MSAPDLLKALEQHPFGIPEGDLKVQHVIIRADEYETLRQIQFYARMSYTSGERQHCQNMLMRYLDDLRGLEENEPAVRARIFTTSSSVDAVPVASTVAAKWREAGEPDPHGTRYDCERAALCMGSLTDDELANAVFMEGDKPFNVEDVLAGKPAAHTYLTAAKDRIRWLSRKLADAHPVPAKNEAEPGEEWWRTTSFACPQCGNAADDGFHSASLGREEAVSCEECDHVFIPQRSTTPAPAAAVEGWREISTLPSCDDEVWLCRGDTYEGPRAPNSGDYDRWDWWCYAEPPFPLPDNKTPASPAAGPGLQVTDVASAISVQLLTSFPNDQREITTRQIAHRISLYLPESERAGFLAVSLATIRQ